MVSLSSRNTVSKSHVVSFYRDSSIFVEKNVSSISRDSEYNDKSEIGFKLGIRFLKLYRLYLHTKITNYK